MMIVAGQGFHLNLVEEASLDTKLIFSKNNEHTKN